MRRCSRMCGWHTATRSGSSRASGILLGSRRRSAVQGLRCIALRRNRLCGARSVTRSMGSLQLEQDEAHRAGATRQIVRPSPALPTDSPEEVDRILREASRSVDDEARKQYADVRAARQEIDRFLRDENTRLAAEAKLAGSKFSPRTIRDLDPDDVSELTGIPRRIVNEAIQDSQIVHKSFVPDMAPGSGAREDRARERVRRAIDEINRRGVEQRGTPTGHSAQKIYQATSEWLSIYPPRETITYRLDSRCATPAPGSWTYTRRFFQMLESMQ